MTQRTQSLTVSELAHLLHEVRGPLGVIVGFADLISDPETEPSQQTQFAQILKRNALQLSALINDVLDFSKIQSGQVRPEIVSFCIKDALEEVVSSFEIAAKKKGVELKLLIASDFKSKIESDPTRIKQILWNLVGNAIKFTDQGSISVLAERDFDTVNIEVKDTGIGLTPAQHEKLFKPFSQADETINRKFGGTGLGLALSKSLAEVLGGSVILKESTAGRGSTFQVRIPA